MPLVESKSKKVLGENIGKEIAAGKPRDQAAAIAYSVQRKAMEKKKDEKKDKKKEDKKKDMKKDKK